MNRIDNVITRFPSAKRSGNHWKARCPAHDDRTPSLSISEGQDGRVLVHCHAGCAPGDICRRVGLSLKDLMPESPHARTGSASRGFVSAEEAILSIERRLGTASAQWRYKDAHGRHVGSIIRWNNSDGTKRDVRPISLIDGKWMPAGLPSPRPLYRLPEIQDAHTVLVVEGEKAADAASGLGFTATTSPHGSQSASKADWTPLSGKHVVILPDNDLPGWKYAAEVHEILTSLNPPAIVQIVELPGLPESGGDIADLASEYGTNAFPELAQLVEAAMAETATGWTPPRDQRLNPKILADTHRTTTVSVPELQNGKPAKPVIWILNGEKPRITDQSLAVLTKDFFQRGGQLVRVIHDPAGSRIVAATEQGIDDTLNRRLEFRKTKINARGEENDQLVDAPPWLSKNICQLQAWAGIRDLDGLRYGPFIRSDGSVGGLKRGYDPASRYWVETDEDWSPLETPPTWEQVRDGIDRLLTLVDEFPFQSDAGTSVWLATVLTRLARPAFTGPAPLIIFNATTPASGKSLLAKLAGIIADGEPPGMFTLSRSEEELRKMLTSALREGEGFLVLDNVTGETGSPTLDRFLTSTQWKDRILGKSENVSLPNLTVPIITANNANIASDTGRRSLSLMLAPDDENPELRQFRISDICGYAMRERRGLLIDAIRILQWFFQNGQPQAKEVRRQDAHGNDVMASVQAFGSFEGWSQVVRQALIYVGLPDPVLTNNELKIRDDKRWSRRIFIEAWRDWNPKWEGSAKQMLEITFPDSGDCPEEAIALREAISELVGESENPNSPTPSELGNQIREFQGRPFSNYRIENVRHTNTGVRWRLSQVVNP